MSIEAMKQALEFIEETNKNSSFWMVPASKLNKTVNALRQAIAEAEQRKYFAPPSKWTEKEIANDYRGIRWVAFDGVYGVPSMEDIAEFFEAEKQEPVADHFDCGTYTGNHIGKEVKHTHLDSDQPKVEQEPVAWRFRTGTFWNREVHWRYVLSLEGTEGLQGLEPLYTTPQPAQKPWVGLTDEEIEKATGCDKTKPLWQIGRAHV